MYMYALQLDFFQILRHLSNLPPHPLRDNLPINAFNIKRTLPNLFSDFRHRGLLLNLIPEGIDDPDRSVSALSWRRGLESSRRRVSQ